MKWISTFRGPLRFNFYRPDWLAVMRGLLTAQYIAWGLFQHALYFGNLDLKLLAVNRPQAAKYRIARKYLENQSMRCKVTDSYSIELPEGLLEDLDTTVTSYWDKEEKLFLQLSSYRLESGPQLAAIERLQRRLLQEGIELQATVRLQVQSPDFAGVVFVDERGWHWLYSYLVWPDLTIFATINTSKDDAQILGSWAAKAIESIERINPPG